MSESSEKIRVGVVGRAHGIHGAIRVFTDDAQSDSLVRIKKVFLGAEQREYAVLKTTRCGRFMALELDGVVDRDAAFALTGQEVFILRQSLRPLRNQWYVCDLVGLTLCDDTGKSWGVIDAVMPSGAHDLLRYKRPAGGTGLVPFVKAHVGKVDLEAKTVTVDAAWMAELDAVYGEA